MVNQYMWLMALFCVAPPLCALEQGKAPNVLILIIDDLNTWLLNRPGRYNGSVIAPNIKGLAESGVNFTQAYTASPKCSPSRTAFLYGVAPWHSGHTDNGLVIKDNEVLARATSFFEEFQKPAISL
ncbi:MAG: sulfatase-like hydrolase/transferase [Spirulinaceae cyanobacterium RM2_2_10]|nr:sulfatase-like hydrolase/transferase [Spirulinaceae cyanobacterium RM2_2_10]